MFRRRNPLPLAQRLRAWLWPQIGWRRLGRYVVKRLTRLSDTPHSIAAGFACGAAVSFTPFMGFHILLGSLLALLMRGNIIAVVIGTLVGNPWTFPLIWLSTFELGHLLLGSPVAAIAPLTHASEVGLFADLGALLWPMTVGGVILGALAWVAIYFPVVRMIAIYQAARRRRRESRRQRRAALGVKPGGASADAGVP